MVRTHPKQFQATLFPILSLSYDEQTPVNTGDIYDSYEETCGKSGLRPLTQRRISDIIGELDMLGIINAKVISKGRFGRTREITVSLSKPIEEKLLNILKEELDL